LKGPGVAINIDPKLPIGVQGNRLIDKGNNVVNFLGFGGKEFYTTQNLYDINLNKNLLEPALISQPKQGKAIMTLRVEMK
jgi:hypothetical protein